MGKRVPLVETSEVEPEGVSKVVAAEFAALRAGFVNWPSIVAWIAFGRLRGQPLGLRMHARSGPVLRTPAGDRSWWTALETFGRDCYRLGSMGLPEAPIVVDVGANIGAFASQVLALRPAARVLCLEPSPRAFAALHANIERNSWSQWVNLWPAALTGAAGASAVLLFERPGDSCTSTVVSDCVGPSEAAGEWTEVPAVTLEHVLASLPEGVDVLKIDVEGAEYDIVAGTPTASLATVRRVVLEYHEVPGRRVEEIAAHLDEAGLVWRARERSSRAGYGLCWWTQSGDET